MPQSEDDSLFIALLKCYGAELDVVDPATIAFPSRYTLAASEALRELERKKQYLEASAAVRETRR